MKKIKVTRRPKTQNEFVLKPNRLRMFLIYTLLFVLAYGLGLLLRYAFNPGAFSLDALREDWLVDALLVFGGPLVLALLDYKRWVVKYQDHQLEGLSGPFGDKTVFPVKEIEWSRTGRSLSSRFKIGNAIYSRTNQRMLISPWFYNSGDYETFLQLIEFEKAIRPASA